MPYLFVRDYEVELMEMNKDLHHVYVESHRASGGERKLCLLYTSPSPRDGLLSRMPSSA